MSSKINTSQLKSLQKEFQATLAPTADETATSAGLDNILASRDLGIVKVNDQPIASDFVQGQGAGLMRQAATQAQPLEQKLARLQATRASAADVLKAKLGFESDNVNRQMTLKAQEDAKKAAKKASEEEKRRYEIELSMKRASQAKTNSGGGALKDLASILNGQQGATSSGFDYNSLF
jgi:hypothetical protein